MSLSYEDQRKQNIKYASRLVLNQLQLKLTPHRENEELLKSLGLSTPGLVRPALLKTPSNASIKKRPRPVSKSTTNTSTPSKVRKPTIASEELGGTPSSAGSLRRSARGSARKNYNEDGIILHSTGSPAPKRVVETKALDDGDFVDDDDDEEEGSDDGRRREGKLRNNKALGVRTQDP